jgi:hypothetical protein
MKIGTKSVLFGAHCFFLHPWFVALGWWTLYGFPWDPRLWVAFFVHDLGYIGKPNMDGPEGEAHPILGAKIMTRMFDPAPVIARARETDALIVGNWRTGGDRPWRVLGHWGAFALLHSRYYAKSLGQQPSRLCMADKLAIALTPAWLYLPMVRRTGELREYMAHAKHRVVGNINISDEEMRRVTSESEHDWYAGVQSYCRRWAAEHADGRTDTWTSDARNRATVNEHGVWQ